MKTFSSEARPRPGSAWRLALCLAATLCAGSGARADFCDLHQPTNLLDNPGFEAGAGASVITNWVLFGSGAREDTNAFGFTGSSMHDGQFAVKGWSDDLNCFQTNIPVVAGRSYEASGCFYHSSTEDVITNSILSTRMFMAVEWFDATGNWLGTDYSANHNGLSAADVWTQITLHATAPANAARATFHVETDRDEGGGSVFGDGLSFKEAWHAGLGWHDNVLVDGESLGPWFVDSDAGASGSLSTTGGISGSAVNLDWNLGAGYWIQARHSFPQPADLSQADLIGVSLRGGGAAELCNQVALLLVDTNDSVYRYDFYTDNSGVNQVDRWMVNISLPKNLFLYKSGPSPIDWTCIDRFVVLVERPAPGEGGGSGSLAVDHVQWARAADWPRQAAFESVAPDPAAASNAISYMLSQQKVTGLIVSWKEEGWHSAYLYDQALALLALTRAGRWENFTPVNTAAAAAAQMAGFLVATQKPGGIWARCWDPNTGIEKVSDYWVGDQAWCTIALSVYAQASGDTAALHAAQACADWIAPQIDGSGKVHDATEANVDAWWAMLATLRFDEADRIEDYLIHPSPIWDDGMKYWRGASYDPHILADCASWLAPFARHARVGHPECGRQALTFVNRTLRATSDDGSLCGISLKGPLTVFNEWAGQYVAAGGEDAQDILDMLVAQQRPDGAMPAAPDDRANDALGWATTWSGLAATAWFYFALTGDPFPPDFRPCASGTVSYGGVQTGRVYVTAASAAGYTGTVTQAAGPYGIAGLVLYATYWFTAYMDSNGNGTQDVWEAEGYHAANPLVATNFLLGIDITLGDPDHDGDGMPDYWEYGHFGNPTNALPGDDADNDGAPNLDEFAADTNPTNAASVFTNAVRSIRRDTTWRVRTAEGTTNSRLYDVYRTSDLLSQSWAPEGLEAWGSDIGAALEFSVTNDESAGFFRTGVRAP